MPLFLSAIADQITRLSYLDSTTKVCDQVCDEYKALLTEINAIQAGLRPTSIVKPTMNVPAPSEVRPLPLLSLQSVRLIVCVHLSGYRRRGASVQ